MVEPSKAVARSSGWMTAVSPAGSKSASREDDGEWTLLCPECRKTAFVAGRYLLCPAEGRRIPKLGGILPLVPEARRRMLLPSVESYRSVRRAEGWGGDASYYLALPFADLSGRHRAIWKIRARSFRAALGEIERGGRRPLKILELGAGNCWFSVRLGRLGHRVMATDISLDAADGLCAFDRYQDRTDVALDRAHLDMEELPLADGQFDIVVANGALHYSRDRVRAIGEAYRVLGPGGRFLVLDSPTYDQQATGDAMVEARMEEHWLRYGIPKVRKLQSGFLLRSEFKRQLEQRGFAVRCVSPFEGWSRLFRRQLARAFGWPPPAGFPVWVGKKVDAP